jgi:hypothetical protein
VAGITSLEGLLGAAAATGVGFGVGVPLAGALEPTAVDIAQNAWGPAPIRVLDARTLAVLVAQGLISADDAYLQANATGIANDRFDLMVQQARYVPPVGELVTLLRRSKLTDAELQHAVQKLQLEPEWGDLVARLAPVALEPAEIAKAIHRGIMKGDGLLVSEPSTVPGKVPIVPQSDLDPIEQAAWSGATAEQLRVMVGNAGLPPGIVQGLELLNRGAITVDDFSRLVGESNMRNEWADVMLTLRRQLLTPREYAEADLRGVMPHDQATAGAALHGLEAADYETLFETVGRPLNVHAITTGLARGGKYGGTYDDVPDGVYRDAIRRSNVRPEYAALAYANRYSYPGLFQLSRLVSSGEINAATAVDWARKSGLAPEVVDALQAEWSKGAGTADPHVSKAQGQLWTAAHKSYVNGLATDADAQADLEALGVAADAIPGVLTLWKAERAVVRRSLTPAQIKKAIGQPGFDAATATQRLLALGYSAADAATYLAE